MKATRLFLILISFGLLFGNVTAQEDSGQEILVKLAKASQNPVADMNSVPFQFNWFTGGGLGDQTMSQTLIQPVIPLRISENWNVVSRTIIPVVSAPLPEGERAKGIGDIQQQIFFSNTKEHKIITGFGPVLSFPTSTHEAWATGQFAAGPAFVFLAGSGHWVIGAVVNNLWRFAGGENTPAINLLFAQPFINFNLKGGWALGTAPAFTANWTAESSQQWTVPLGMSISKVTVIGKQPLNLSIQYYHNVVRPDNAGSEQVRFLLVFLFPK